MKQHPVPPSEDSRKFALNVAASALGRFIANAAWEAVKRWMGL